ncbi:hypothetical protein [Spirobacillus cienkowskii]
MKKNTFSFLAAAFSLIAIFIGIIKLIPHFNSNANLDRTWIIFITTGFPLMIFIYAISGFHQSAKNVAANAYGLILALPTIIAFIYLKSWLGAVCMVLTSILIVAQLFVD